jgi:anion-transporting  ArsA/GET3 family ATPase
MLLYSYRFNQEIFIISTDSTHSLTPIFSNTQLKKHQRKISCQHHGTALEN